VRHAQSASLAILATPAIPATQNATLAGMHVTPAAMILGTPRHKNRIACKKGRDLEIY
jgi:hypothetical protein